MIDSCDATIACWSEDGETFIVKDPTKFEQEIIPQFFKHSKFTSFVRQLNFYSFRKIKYMDTLRLDPKLEAETANYWRFRHEKFQRGKPHLLMDIKRLTGHKGASPGSIKKGPLPLAATSGNDEGSVDMQNELDTLKKRIEEMNNSMSQLTSMVQKVSLNSKDGEPTRKLPSRPSLVTAARELVVDKAIGSKRKKVDWAFPLGMESSVSLSLQKPEPILSPYSIGSTHDSRCIVPPDEMLSSAMDFESVFTIDVSPDEPVLLNPLEASVTNVRPCNDAVEDFYILSEDECNDDDDALVDICRNDTSETSIGDNTAANLLPDPSTRRHQVASLPEATLRPRDRVDPELMDRLSEALAVLPKEMQNQIVERLIAAITTTELFAAPSNVAPYRKRQPSESSTDDASYSSGEDHQASGVGMPLAAATLAALLSHYSEQVKKHSTASVNKDKVGRSGVKAISVIPVHA
jgi:HSF-type DNA-binding